MNVYAVTFAMREHLDLSDYDHTSPFCDGTNRIVGKFKDETNGKPILEFVGLRPRVYSILLANNGGQRNTSNGICKAVREKFKHEDYLRQLREPGISYATTYSIRQHLHELATVQQNKCLLCSLDDKRYTCADNVHTLAYGH
jgi:hypothetical protein